MAMETKVVVSNNNASSKEFHNLYGTNIFSLDQNTFACTTDFITNFEEPQDYCIVVHSVKQTTWKQTMEE
jgi:hypothetical protein